jgi:hypothetical protein
LEQGGGTFRDLSDDVGSIVVGGTVRDRRRDSLAAD